MTPNSVNPESTPDLYNPQTKIEAGSLTLTCPKCLKFRRFTGANKTEAYDQARQKGWKFRGEQTVCRQCP